MAATANKQFPRLAGALSALAALGAVSSAHALDWRFEPSVGASATYTDNVNQSASNAENALILRVTPGFTLQSEGSRRVEATVSYNLDAVARFGGGSDNDLYHNLTGRGRAELVEDFLFIDADARVSQELISLLGSPASAFVNDSNRATTGSYSISPYVKRRLGTFAEAQARYTLSGALFEDDVFSDLLNNEFRASLVSGTRFTDLNWGLDYSFRDVSDRQGGAGDTSYTYERANLSLGYALTRKFRLIGNVGHEWIEYDSALASANDRDDSYWSGGFAWTPSRRTSLEATMGQRFFGNTYSLSASYRAREAVFTASYLEDVNDISQVTLTQGTTYVWLCGTNFVETVFPIAPQPGCIPIGTRAGLVPSLANGLFVSKTLRAGVTWGIRKVTYSFNASDVRRTYLLQSDAEDRTQSINAAVNYRMTPLTSLFGNVALDWIQEDAALSGLSFDRDDEWLGFTLGINHQFSRDLTGALTFRHYKRDSNDPTAEYTENNITATVNMSF